MSAQLRILRVFRWVAIFTIISAANAAGFDLYLLFSSGSCIPDSEGEIVSNLIEILQGYFGSILSAGLVWILATTAEKYLKIPAEKGNRGPLTPRLSTSLIDNERVAQIVRWLALIIVVVAFYSSCHLMFRTIYYDDYPPKYHYRDYERTSTRAISIMVESGRTQWNMMLMAMLVWIVKTAAAKYLRMHRQIDSQAEDYRDRQIT